MKKLILLTTLILCTYIPPSVAQTYEVSSPEVGRKIHEFVFKDLLNTDLREISTFQNDGKWLIFDFWGEGCTACIKSFPRMDSLSHNYKDKIKLVLVGVHSGGDPKDQNSSINRIKKTFRFYKQKYNLKMPAAFDGQARELFKPKYVPYILIVNPEGYIVAKTTQIDSIQLAQLLVGKHLSLGKALSSDEKAPWELYDNSFPFLTNGNKTNGGIDTGFLFRSMITKWNASLPALNYGFNRSAKSPTKGRAEILGADLATMLRFAYFGYSSWYPGSLAPDSIYQNVANQIIWNTNDSSFYGKPNTITGDNLYCYSLVLPEHKSSIASNRKCLLTDLQRFFSFNSTIELRSIPVWKVVIINKDVVKGLKTKGGSAVQNIGPGNIGFDFKNVSLTYFIQATTARAVARLYAFNEAPPILNETGIDYEIDFAANDLSLYDLNDLKKAFKRRGLDIILGEKKLRCIVVNDL